MARPAVAARSGPCGEFVFEQPVALSCPNIHHVVWSRALPPPLRHDTQPAQAGREASRAQPGARTGRNAGFEAARFESLLGDGWGQETADLRRGLR